jgi:hypothetical protein
MPLFNNVINLLYMTNMPCEKTKIPPEQRQLVFSEEQNHHFTIIMSNKPSLSAQCFCLSLCQRTISTQ